MKQLVFVLLLAQLGAADALAQRTADPLAPEARRWSFQTGIGFAIDPDAFVLGFDGGYRFDGGFSLGAALQLGLDDDFTMVSPVAYLRYSFDLKRMGAPDSLSRLSPFVLGGLGFSYIDRDAPPFVDDDDIGFLLNTGFGVEYRFTPVLSVGSKMLFNFLPTGVFSENFYYSWEVATLRFHF